MHVYSSLGDFLEIFKLTSSRDVIEWRSVEFTVYQYARIAKIRRHRVLETVGQN